MGMDQGSVLSLYHFNVVIENKIIITKVMVGMDQGSVLSLHPFKVMIENRIIITCIGIIRLWWGWT